MAIPLWLTPKSSLEMQSSTLHSGYAVIYDTLLNRALRGEKSVLIA